MKGYQLVLLVKVATQGIQSLSLVLLHCSLQESDLLLLSLYQAAQLVIPLPLKTP